MSGIVWRPHKIDGRTVYVRSYWDGRRWALHGDTYFSVPAFIRSNGRRIKGFVTQDEGAFTFHRYKAG